MELGHRPFVEVEQIELDAIRSADRAIFLRRDGGGSLAHAATALLYLLPGRCAGDR